MSSVPKDNTKLKKWSIRAYRIFKKIKGNPKSVLKAVKILLTHSPGYSYHKLLSLDGQNNQGDRFQRYQKYFNNHYPHDSSKIRKQLKSLNRRPLLSVIMPIYNPQLKFLREALDSVLNQAYTHWELCLADDHSTKPGVVEIIKEYADKDSRIKYVLRPKNGHICKASNSALKMATGDYIVLLDNDDLLWPNALYEIAKTVNEHPEADLIYSDEDKLMEDGNTHTDPFFKPDWSPDYLRSVNYITHLAAIKSQSMKKLKGFKVGTEGAQDWDLFLRLSHISQNIIHIPKILYSWRMSPTSTASEIGARNAKNYAYINQKMVLEADLKRRGLKGEILPTEFLGVWQIKYKITGNPKISIIIPTKDKFELISQNLSSLFKKTTYKNYEVIIIDTGSGDPKVWQLYQKLSDKIKVFKWNKDFNFSEVCNFGVRKSKGDYFLFLNNDTEIISPDWIQGMLSLAQLKHIGAVSCKLLYPDKKIQHLGGLLGITGDPDEIGIAGHAFRGQVNNFNLFNSKAIKNYSFVTGACMMVSKYKYSQVYGFDPQFKIAFNDIDFCLKLFRKGYYNAVNPHVSLFHKESASLKKPGEAGRDINQWKKEIKLFLKRWNNLRENDPFSNQNFSKDTENFDNFIT